MKKRNLVIGLLVMLAVIVSGFTFAFWASGLDGTTANLENQQIRIGSGKNATSTLTLNPVAIGNKLLVPANRVDDSAVVEGFENVASITVEFTVAWNEDVDSGESANFAGSTGSLAVTMGTVTIGGSTVHAGLVNFALPANVDIIEGEDAITVSITVTLTEPLTQEVYNAIFGQIIAFTVVFTVTPTTLVTP